MSDRLVAALHDLPVDWPAVPAIDLRPRRARTAWVPAVAAVFIVVALGVATPVRQAVADLLGIGVVTVVQVDRLPSDLETALDLGEPAGIDTIGRSWQEPPGAPAAAFVRPGEVSAVWPPSAVLPEVGASGVGAILTRFDGTLDPAIEKSIGPGSLLQVIAVGDTRAYWIEGEPHGVVQLDRDGRPIVHSARLAGNTLVWEDGGFTWRFESGLDLESVLGLGW